MPAATPSGPWPVPVVLDAAGVLVFAAVGARTHGSGDGVVAVAGVAWPFLVGLALGWVLVLAAGRRRAGPQRRWLALPVVWGSTLVAGMVLRRITGQGTAWEFVVVAAVTLAVLFSAWRVVAALRHSRWG